MWTNLACCSTEIAWIRKLLYHVIISFWIKFSGTIQKYFPLVETYVSLVEKTNTPWWLLQALLLVIKMVVQLHNPLVINRVWRIMQWYSDDKTLGAQLQLKKIFNSTNIDLMILSITSSEKHKFACCSYTVWIVIVLFTSFRWCSFCVAVAAVALVTEHIE